MKHLLREMFLIILERRGRKMEQKIENSLKLIRDTISFKYIVIYVLATIFLVLCIFGNLDAKIIELYARNNKEVIASKFLNSTMKTQYIDELNSINTHSNSIIYDINFSDGVYTFSIRVNENNPNGTPLVTLPKNDDRIIQMYVEHQMREFSEWNLSAIFPLVFNVLISISNQKRFSKYKKIIELFLLPISIMISFLLFRIELLSFVFGWDVALHLLPIFTKIFLILDFTAPIFNSLKRQHKE